MEGMLIVLLVLFLVFVFFGYTGRERYGSWGYSPAAIFLIVGVILLILMVGGVIDVK